MTHHINCWSVLHILMPKSNEYVKMLLTNNTIESKHPNSIISHGEIEFVLSILRRRSLTELTAQFLLGNSLQMCLMPHPFCWQTSLMDALSSYIKCMFINKLLVTMTLHCFPHCVSCRVGLLSFLLSNYKLLKIFPRNSHMILRINYISTCVIHFQCTLLWHAYRNWLL